KFALQNGATYVPDAGLMGAGAGSVNFWASRRIAAGSAGTPVTTTIGGAPVTSSGASLLDIGTLPNRLDAGTGARGLSQEDATIAWADPSFLRFGDLNLLGMTNPLAAMLPKTLMYGSVADWTSTASIGWGTAIQDPHGATILW